MSIKSCFKRTINNFEFCLESNNPNINKARILEWIISTWKDLRVFTKKIDPQITDHLDYLINDLSEDELIITTAMFSEGIRIYSSLRNELNNVKSFINNYTQLINCLLIFNRPDEEACDICQGELYYYFDELHNYIIRECSTCGSACMYKDGEFVTLQDNYEIKLRRAKLSELSSILTDSDI